MPQHRVPQARERTGNPPSQRGRPNQAGRRRPVAGVSRAGRGKGSNFGPLVRAEQSPRTTAPARAGPRATAPVRARRRPAAAAAVGGDSVAARELAAHVMSATNGRARARARLVAAACFAAAAASDAPGTAAAGAADPRHAAAEGGRRLPQPKPTGPTQSPKLLPCPCCCSRRCHTPVEGRGR